MALFSYLTFFIGHLDFNNRLFLFYKWSISLRLNRSKNHPWFRDYIKRKKLKKVKVNRIIIQSLSTVWHRSSVGNRSKNVFKLDSQYLQLSERESRFTKGKWKNKNYWERFFYSFRVRKRSSSRILTVRLWCRSRC